MDKTGEFIKIEKILLNYSKPGEELRKIITSDEAFESYPLKWIKDLGNIMQNKLHHPEGDALTHTLMVVDEAAGVKHLSKNKKVFMWGALLHDIGKLKTTAVRRGKLTAYGHDKVGAQMAEEFLQFFSVDEETRKNIVALVRWHMQPLFIANNIPLSQLEEMIEEVEIEEIALLCRCDRFGRGNLDEKEKKIQKDKINKFISKAENVKKKRKMGLK